MQTEQAMSGAQIYELFKAHRVTKILMFHNECTNVLCVVKHYVCFWENKVDKT